MKTFKKITAVAVVLVMVLSFMTVGSVFAVDGGNAVGVAAESKIVVELTPSSATVKPGETVDITIDVYSDNGNFKAGALGFSLNLNTDVFEISDVKYSTYYDELEGKEISDWIETSGFDPELKIYGFNAVGTAIRTKDNAAYKAPAVMTLKAKDSATDGKQVLEILDYGAVNPAFDDIEGVLNNAEVTIDSSVAPPTEAPTEAPTAPPVTEPPVTAPPVTEPPVTAPPVTEPPVTAPPVTEPPVTEAPATATPIPVREVSITTDKDVESITLVGADGTEYPLTMTETETGKKFTADVEVGYYTVVAKAVEGREIDLAKSDLDVTVGKDDVKLNVVTTEKSTIDSFSIDKYPTKAEYAVGEAFDAAGLSIIVVKEGDQPVTVVYGDDTKADFTFKPEKIAEDTTTIEVIYANRSQKYTLASRGTIVKPVSNKAITTEVEVPGDALYTASAINWSPSVTEKFDYSTIYTATYTITAKAGYTLNSDIFATVNGKDAEIVVAADGKTAEVTYVFPRTSSKSSGNSGGPTGGSTGGSATSTPKPVATKDPSATTEPSDQVFNDVPKSHWAYDHIMDLYDAGIVNGYSATQFMPDGNVTRAEFTKMVAVMFDFKATSTSSQFTDVKSSDWFAEYVIAATEAGIIKGISDTEFAPNENVTREQMATIIGRELGETSTTALKYTDASEIESYALPYVAGLTAKGYLKGDENNAFRPKSNSTRAESATLLNRVYQAEVKTDEPKATATPSVTADPKATPSATEEPVATATATPVR